MSTSVPSVPGPRFLTSTSPFSHLAKKSKDQKDDVVDDVVDDDDTDDGDDDEDGDDEEAKAKKARKKAKKKAEDADDEADEANAATRSIRLRERTRIRVIMNSAAGKQSPQAALHLALTTGMARNSAVKLLSNMNENVPQSENLRDRMMGVASPDVGVGAAQQSHNPGPAGLAAAIIAAGCKRRGETT
jgi:hypothetical protein